MSALPRVLERSPCVEQWLRFATSGAVTVLTGKVELMKVPEPTAHSRQPSLTSCSKAAHGTSGDLELLGQRARGGKSLT